MTQRRNVPRATVGIPTQDDVVGSIGDPGELGDRGEAGKPLFTATPALVIDPEYYQRVVRGQLIEAVDVIEGWFPQDAHLAHAFKYMSRAGRKNGQPYITDIRKAKWWIDRALKHVEERLAREAALNE